MFTLFKKEKRINAKTLNISVLYEKEIWIYARSSRPISGLRTKKRNECYNGPSGENHDCRVKIDHQKRFFGNCRSRGVCEAGIPGQRTNHQPACHRRRESKEGTIDCSYRPQGHRLQYAATKSAYETAAAQVERNKRLLSRQAISVQEYEISLANYQKAKSEYELSVNNMRDTKLTAPFDGSIEKRLVENYQRVNSGEGIVQLVNTHNLRIKFTIPDAYLYLLRTKDPRFLVEFDTFKGHVFQAKLEEYLDISTDGTGIPVSITIDDPSFDRDLYAVKPGFTCSIRFTADVGPLVQDSWTIIPLSAVFGESEGKKMYVWVVEDNKVHKREVTVNAPTGEAQVLISKGLKPEEKIVIAGVYQLVEGENVKDIEK